MAEAAQATGLCETPALKHKHESKSDGCDVSAETSPSLFFLALLSCDFLCLLFTPIIRPAQELLLHRGNSQRSQHLKVIENKVSNPCRMHDIQSVGHTWLLADKTLSSSNSRCSIVASVGGQEDTSDAFQIHSALPSVGWAFDRAGQRFASLCDGVQSDAEITRRLSSSVSFWILLSFYVFIRFHFSSFSPNSLCNKPHFPPLSLLATSVLLLLDKLQHGNVMLVWLKLESSVWVTIK